ncbi:zinc finger protein 189 [Drosophila tropicalis]|uniref:zinc finger protein 189 n=1 Tax=Drosophila tropicalis TaxID=46794 RepID=UPI0035ABA167
MNVDISDIIEFVLPPKTEYPDEDNDQGGAGGGSAMGIESAMVEAGNRVVDDVEDDDVGTTYVVLDTLGQDYGGEEFLIVNEDGHDAELMMDELENCRQLMTIKYEDDAVVNDIEGFDEETIGIGTETAATGEEEKFYLNDQQFENMDNVVQEEGSQDALDEFDQDEFQITSEIIKEETEVLEEQIETTQTTQSKPSDKMVDEFKGPRRYLLFDDLIATIVEFDEDNTPIVEFSMITSPLDEKLLVECGICPDVMHKSKLSKHQKTHLVPGTNRYACIYCTETYRDCKYLAGHARRHMGIRPYVCELCKLYFSTKQDLRVHNQRRHLRKDHICELCAKSFAQHTQLKRHREATHEKKRRFQCTYCNKAYFKNFSLQEHIRNVHMGKRRMLKCPFCGMQCRDAHKMARHRKEMHLNQDSYVCHLCQEEFTDINYFDAHKRSIQCRSNTRRLTNDQTNAQSEMGDINLPENEDEFDEDAGLLVVEEVTEGDIEQQDYGLNQSQYALLVEADGQIVGEDGQVAENLHLLDEGQYFAAMEQQQQHLHHHNSMQIQHAASGQCFADDDLIYEITLETEDN